MFDKRMPALGETIYRIYGKCIFVDTVYAIASKEFILESFLRNAKEEYYLCKVEGAGSAWFTDLDTAIEHLMSDYDETHKLVKYSAEWYEVEKV